MTTVTIMRNGQPVEVPYEEVFVETASPVPASVPATKAKLALLAIGKYEAAIAAVAAAGPEAEIYWNSATVFERAHPLIAQLGAAIGLDEEGIDDRFRAAEAL